MVSDGLSTSALGWNMMRLRFYLFVLAILAISIVGCKQESSQGFTQSRDGMVAVFEMSPASPVMMEPVTLSLSLTGPGGEAIEGAQVSYELTMPGMTMPPNKPQASDEGQGVYRAEATFTMAGEWRAQALIVYSGTTTIFTFDFSVE
jgi:hypothetical protein